MIKFGKDKSANYKTELLYTAQEEASRLKIRKQTQNPIGKANPNSAWLSPTCYGLSMRYLQVPTWCPS